MCVEIQMTARTSIGPNIRIARVCMKHGSRSRRSFGAFSIRETLRTHVQYIQTRRTRFDAVGVSSAKLFAMHCDVFQNVGDITNVECYHGFNKQGVDNQLSVYLSIYMRTYLVLRGFH